MYTCAIANLKGGVGKTTTTYNLGMRLAEKLRVLLIDLDAQANLTDACLASLRDENSEPEDPALSSFELLDEGIKFPFDEAVIHLRKNLDLIPAKLDLAGADLVLSTTLARESRLTNVLRHNMASERYDIVLIDCPPNLGLVTINALLAADGVIIPVQAEYFAYTAIDLMSQTLERIRADLNHDIAVTGILITDFDKRRSLAHDVLKYVRRENGDLVFDVVIRSNTALAESPSFGQSIFEYRPASHGALDYSRLAKEFLARVAKAELQMAQQPVKLSAGELKNLTAAALFRKLSPEITKLVEDGQKPKDIYDALAGRFPYPYGTFSKYFRKYIKEAVAA